MCKDQVLDPEDFTLPVYTIDNYCNIYFKDFALDPIWIEDLESSISCLAPLVQKKIGRPKKKRLWKSAQKKNKAKKHCTIYDSENHNRQQCDQKPNAKSDFEAEQETEDDENIVFSDIESTWNGFSGNNKEQSSDRQGL